jgi:hypothetical protein
MKIYLFIIGFLVSTLSAEMFDDSEVSYSYDIEMSDDDSVIKYLVDTTFYDQFSAEVLGVYVLYDDVPMKITKEVDKLARILTHYIYVTENPKYKIPREEPRKKISLKELQGVLNKTLDTKQLMSLVQNEYLNHTPDARSIIHILKANGNTLTIDNLEKLYASLESYLDSKIALYVERNNKQSVKFFITVKRLYLTPIGKILLSLKEYYEPIIAVSPIRDKYETLAIKGLNKKELKLVWDEFKENNLGLIQTYFDANKKKLKQLDENNSFEINLNDVEWDGMPKFYICLNIFGQKWHLRIDDYYVSGLHKVNLIKL